MTYFEGFVVPVQETNRDAFVTHANEVGQRLKGCGVRRQVEAWGNDISEGKLTDFRKAVDAKDGETAAFAWFEYPDRKARDQANEQMMSDPKMMEMSTDVPFDAKRMIIGGFESVVDEGSGRGGYIDGVVIPVPKNNGDAYGRLASENAKLFLEQGAVRIVEALGDDVPHGNATDFYRAVQAEPEETVAFSFIEWPDKATRDQAWQKIMDDGRMQHGGDLFDGKRMFWGGFEVVVDTGAEKQAANDAAPLSA